jgi:hypothetical protein
MSEFFIDEVRGGLASGFHIIGQDAHRPHSLLSLGDIDDGDTPALHLLQKGTGAKHADDRGESGSRGEIPFQISRNVLPGPVLPYVIENPVQNFAAIVEIRADGQANAGS